MCEINFGSHKELLLYTDPELYFTGAALASRAITDLAVGREILVRELDIFSRK